MKSSGAKQTLTLVAFTGVLVTLGLVAMVVGVIAIILPASSSGACQGAASIGVEAVNVPPGLSRLASELWDKPLQMTPGRWYPVGATEYYEEPSSGTGHIGSIPDPAQDNLEEHPNSFAELSLLPENPANTVAGFTFSDANALGNLPYMTALRVAREGRSIILYKRDIGYGQGPMEHTEEGFEYRIDLWRPSAEALGVTKSQVAIELAPKAGAAETLDATSESQLSEPAGSETEDGELCLASGGVEGPLPLTAGQQARVLPDGLAAAPAEAPPRVKAMIAAGNRLYGKPYVYGGGHGEPLSTLQPAYDCSSAVSYVLHAGGVFGEYAEDSTELESYGDPGPGKWVTVYANSEHAFMYVAGLRFDTAYEGIDEGPNAGKSGPRWRVLNHVPEGQWVVRHPPGL
jgi:cell wall-associated NlpC family hydrolase